MASLNCLSRLRVILNEITENLACGQQVFDHPGIVTKVLQMKEILQCVMCLQL